MPDKIYITSALPYVNSSPHIGFVFELVFTDVLARHFRSKGYEVYFLTGSDENSFKIARTAAQKGINPADLADENSNKFKKLKELLNISYNSFFRTSTEAHKLGVQQIWSNIRKEDMYRGIWSSWYCVGCESFYSKNNLLNGNLCPEHLKELEYVNEEDTFFNFNKYKNELITRYSENKINIVPSKRKESVINEINKFHNFNISRKKESKWGVEVPGNNEEVIYAFFEALMGYINGIGYYDNTKKFKYWWSDPKSRIIHIIGRGITKFHTIYWPCLLMSIGLKLPTDIVIHNYLTINGQKISKSLGNTIDISELVDKYGTDSIRFYLMRCILPFEDTEFSTDELATQHKNKADIETMLISLVSKFNQTYKTKQILSSKNKNQDCRDDFLTKFACITDEYNKKMDMFELNDALNIVLTSIKCVNKYISKEKNYDIKSNQIFNKALKKIISMMDPFIPDTVRKISSICDLEI